MSFLRGMCPPKRLWYVTARTMIYQLPAGSREAMPLPARRTIDYGFFVIYVISVIMKL